MEGLYVLRTALKANGFFSLATALLTMVLAGTVDAVSEMANGQPLAFSLQLFIFGGVVLFAAYRKRPPTILIWVIIVLDYLYVLLGFYNLAAVFDVISAGGQLLIAITNLIVAVFAIFQTIGIVKYKKSIRTSLLQ